MTSPLRSFGMLALAVVATACGSGQTLTSPSGALGASSPANHDVSASLELRTLAGRFIDILTGAAAADVTMHIAGVGDVAGDAAGQFSLDTEAPDGNYRVPVSGAGVVARETNVTMPGQAPIISLIPSAFNLVAFDQMARQFGEPAGVTKRWMQAPALVIETAIVDAQSVDAAGIPQYPAIASATRLSEESINEIVAHLTRALPLMSGGAFPAFSAIDRSTTEAGAPIEMDRPGTITVVRYNGLDQLCRGYTYFLYDGVTLEAASSRLFMQTCGAIAGAAPLSAVVAHELGHALGFAHVSAAPSVMAATVFTDVTDFDRQVAAIVFQRPAGNQAPDVDPEIPVPAAPVRFSGRTRVIGPVP